MKPRLHYAKAAPGVYEAMDALDQYLQGCGLEESLLHLARLRASQINGYEGVRPHFSEKELCALTLAVAAINAWNRLSISARLVPGVYQPAKVAS